MVNDERTIGMNPSKNTLLYPTIKSTQHQKKMSSFHVNPVQPVTQLYYPFQPTIPHINL